MSDYNIFEEGFTDISKVLNKNNKIAQASINVMKPKYISFQAIGDLDPVHTMIVHINPHNIVMITEPTNSAFANHGAKATIFVGGVASPIHVVDTPEEVLNKIEDLYKKNVNGYTENKSRRK